MASENTMEFESDLLKTDRNDKERQGLLDDVLKEIQLFNLNKDENMTIWNEENKEDMEDESQYQASSVNPPGIKFFDGKVNCIYSMETIKSEKISQLLDSKDLTNLETLTDIESMIRRDSLFKDSSTKKILYVYFLKLLFTKQSEEFLTVASSIAIEIINKTKQPELLLKKTIEILPTAVRNLGGKVSSIYSKETLTSLPPDDEDTICQDQFNPLCNLRSILNVLTRLVAIETQLSGDKADLSIMAIDDLVLLLLAMSQDPYIINSTLIPDMQNCLAFILDAYPPDSAFPEKIQDIVERVGIYWDDSAENFHHYTASYTTFNVLPLTRRGKSLKASLSYYALMCCITPSEVDVLEVVELPMLLRYCQDNVETMKDKGYSTLISVLSLIDSSIDGTVNNNPKYKEDLTELIKTVNCLLHVKDFSNDLCGYNRVRCVAVIKELTSEWLRLVDHPKEDII